jgi:glycine oxidase
MKVLVVGQGIAGALLAHALKDKGAQVTMADTDLPGKSSTVAAGIINPVTGKRFVKSWRFDDFFPVAQAMYQALEAELGVKIWEERPLLRVLNGAEEANNWSARCTEPEYEGQLAETKDAGAWSALLNPGFFFGSIKKAARVNFPNLLSAFRAKVQAAGQLLDKEVKYDDTETLLKIYDRVIYCEGHQAINNPFFPDLPWQLAKGESLVIRFEDPNVADAAATLKKTTLVTPLGGGLFWAGGSFQWNYPDLAPSNGEREYILMHLKELFAAPFEVLSHAAGVRPAVKDRRPFLGESVVLPNVFMFNGLGSKGALLAPYWAEHLAAHLLEDMPINETVWVGRII